MDQWNFVMHPVYAAKSADPDGAYVRRWCPELAGLPREFVHCPWEAPATTLAAANVALGRHYPKRIVLDLEDARRKSLKAVVDVRRAHPEYVLPDGTRRCRCRNPDERRVHHSGGLQDDERGGGDSADGGGAVGRE